VTTCRTRPPVLAATQTGCSHESSGAPCQDAFAWVEAGDRLLVIAVADGLGTAPRAEEGAAVAVEAAVNAALAACHEGPQAALGALARGSVEAARAALESLADDGEVPLSALATTLIVVAASGDRVCVAQVGDGAVVAEGPDALALLSAPAHGEYVNEVTPLTAETWAEAVRVSPEVAGVRALAAFTDGCEPAALRHRASGDLVPHEGFFVPLFEFARAVGAGASEEGELRDLLAGAKMAASSDDDKTLVLAILDQPGDRPSGQPADKLSDHPGGQPTDYPGDGPTGQPGEAPA